jgi:phage tail sheath protein FI
MPATLSYPGVYIEEVSSGVRTITGVPTSIGLFVGWAARGPTDRALRLTNFGDFERAYGPLDARSLLGYSVRHFFDNGGADLYVLRIAYNDAKEANVNAGSMTFHATSTGAWANDYQLRIKRRADDATRFTLEVLLKSNVVEVFENLSLGLNDPRFIESAVNKRSGVVTVAVTGATIPPDGTVIDLDNTQAGEDGKVLVPTDPLFHAEVLKNFGPGTVTDRLDLFNIVCVPGLTEATTIDTLQKHCKDRRAFLIVDSIEGAKVGDMPAALSGLTKDNASYAALYYPWVLAPDPLQPGTQRLFPPSGFIAGIYARTDTNRGVWKAPAGADAGITGASALAFAMSDGENGQLNPLGINCLRTLPVYDTVVWGARTLHGNNDRASEWKYVPVRRMALFLEESLYRGTQWVVFEPNDEPLWAQIRLNIGAFMQGLFRQGAFQGRSPREAYFVKCDRETTTQNDINLGIVNIHVGFAPLKPAEFVVIRVQQIAGDIAV